MDLVGVLRWSGPAELPGRSAVAGQSVPVTRELDRRAGAAFRRRAVELNADLILNRLEDAGLNAAVLLAAGELEAEALLAGLSHFYLDHHLGAGRVAELRDQLPVKRHRDSAAIRIDGAHVAAGSAGILTREIAAGVPGRNRKSDGVGESAQPAAWR